MKKLGLNELREMYLKFFESKDHLREKSYSLVPENDDSLLLVNAGMAPLKAYFTGQEEPPSKRMTTCQKCIRTGDIENVGKTARHGTFFEMLGNFSFADYFKEESIAWAWEFLVDELEIPKDKLYVSVYEEDQEAADIWHEQIHVPKDKIFFLGKEENFWEVGEGPCGPSSEIYFDRGERYGCKGESCTVGCECDRYMEIWNLVFTQFNKEADGSYTPLEHPNIDTGMGLERLAVMMQDVGSIFDVDTIKAIRDHVCQIAGIKYGVDSAADISVRIITDHIRSAVFMASDGILPANEGRGYVMRRLIRRAVRHGKLLGIKGLFLEDLAKTVIENSKHEYTDLEDRFDYILKIITVEEERFNETIDIGLNILKKHIRDLKNKNEKSLFGSKAFKLYDTYGFPLDLTREILEEEGLWVDEKEFNKEMEDQRNRARSARKESSFLGSDNKKTKIDSAIKSRFLGYEKSEIDNSEILAIVQNEEIVDKAVKADDVWIVTDNTPFYAESGGQAGDIGYISTSTGRVKVLDTKYIQEDQIIHIGQVVEGEIKLKQAAKMEIDRVNRLNVARNHTATHLLQQALKDVLGSHVEQAGSDVNADRLRFDFTHFQALTKEELEKIETLVNEQVFKSSSINMIETSIDKARDMGATALFGEKYSDKVRVISMNDYSVELCGGTHLNNTAQVGTFKITSEAGVSSGVRRIEALTGRNALKFYQEEENKIKEMSKILKTNPERLIPRVESLLEEIKNKDSQLESMQSQISKAKAGDILDKVENVAGVDLLVARMDELDMDGLRNMGDNLKDQVNQGVIVLGTAKDDKVNFIVMANKEALDKGVHAGKMISEIAKLAGGGGGGRPNMAQAGGRDVLKIDEALEKAKEILKTQIDK